MGSPSFQGGFEFVEHTADIAARLRGGSLEALFQAAALAFTEALTDAEAVRPVDTRRLELAAAELDLLLIDWLEELLFLFETEGFLVRKADIVLTESTTGTGNGGAEGSQLDARHVLAAAIHGETREPSRHQLKLLIKAVTYHGLHITRAAEGYEATVIFDI